MRELIQNACFAVRNRLQERLRIQRTHNRPANATPGSKRQDWAGQWIGRPTDQWDWREKTLVERDWTERWQGAQRQQEQDQLWRTGIKLVLEDTPPTKQVLKLHGQLQKAESSLLV